MKRILLVEDDAFLREALADQLTEGGFHVVQAANGKVAKDIFPLQTFDLVLGDIQMPFFDGVELLKWIRLSSSTPVILMTGFTNLLDIQSAHDLGANDFLGKPFKGKDLMAAVKKIFDAGKKPEVIQPNLDLEYCKVSIEEFVARSKIDFDVFIRLSEKKYIKIGVAGTDIPLERIRSYQQKGARHLHIRREDFAKLVEFNLHLSKTVAKSSKVSPEKKVNFMRYTAEVILEKAFVDGIDQESFAEAKEMLGTTLNVLTESAEHLSLLDILNSHSDWIYAHSVATSMFALMIARTLGHTTTQVFHKIGMAGLFHEIGYKEISREILERPRPLLTQAERTMIETHPTRGREILSEIKGIPDDVIEIVYQHHEDNLGQGYPRRLTKQSIHPLAKIFQAADLFADAALKSPLHPGSSSAQAYAYVEKFHGEKLEKELLTALKTVFAPSASAKVSKVF